MRYFSEPATPGRHWVVAVAQNRNALVTKMSLRRFSVRIGHSPGSTTLRWSLIAVVLSRTFRCAPHTALIALVREPPREFGHFLGLALEVLWGLLIDSSGSR